MPHTHSTASHKSCIRLVPIFNHLNDNSMDLIEDKLVQKTFKKGEYLYQAQDSTDALYIINSGVVRVFRIVESGKEQLVRVLNPGDFVGELAIFNPGSVHEDYAQAMKSTTICMVYQKDLQDFLYKYPDISFKLLGEMSNRLGKSEKQTTQVSTEQVGTRLALFIADQVHGDEEKDVTVDLPLSRKDIASYLGTTPETISRKFKQLENENLIVQLSMKKIKISDVNDLLFDSE